VRSDTRLRRPDWNIPMTDLETPLTRILTVEDFAPHRLLVASLLRGRPGLLMVGEVSDGLAAVEKALELKPDVILMDIGLPGLNGIEAARRIRELAPHSRIVFLTQESSPDVIKEALALGAHGYVLKSEMETDLVPALSAAMQGRQFVSGCEA
jgi:DNA-binding NarL/FixJ family response regulator